MQYTMSIDKDFKTYFHQSDSVYAFPFKTPQICPICGMSQGGIYKEGQFYNAIGMAYWFATFECTECHKIYGLVFNVYKTGKRAEFKTFHPTVEPTYTDDVLGGCSPRFVKMYRQALMSEYHGHYDVAAIGYRAALEILIKDYAVNELSATLDEVQKLNLAKAIKKYLGSDEASAADVVRLLGNDYAHYLQGYPDIEFSVLKEYMDIFISQIRVKLRLAHPPTQKAADSPGQT